VTKKKAASMEIKRGLDFIADRDNKSQKRNLRTLYQMTVAIFWMMRISARGMPLSA